VARARPVPDLRPDQAFATAAARIVAVRADELLEHSHEVLDLNEAERVHDMRVATRRLRAVLEVFRPCFPKKPYKRVIAELKDLADALGERRDRDVQIEGLSEFAASLDEGDRAGVQRLIDAIDSERPVANLALAPRVTEEHVAELCERLAHLVAVADAEGRTP
jgi:CHAD domain-containing protein